MSTPHLSAHVGDYAPTVLMPGDPLRAKFIADTYLDDVRQVNDVRNMLGFTGTFQGQRLSVQSHGMGIPSMQIYATELVKDFGAEQLIRIGSCGALQDDIALGDVVVAMTAGTDSTVNRRRLEGRDFPAAADYHLLRSVTDAAELTELSIRVGSVFTSDFFYEPEGSNTFALLERYGFLAVEMEAAGLYGVAAEYGAAALCVATVSDQLKTGEHLDPKERQTSFGDMISLVLNAVAA